MPESKSLSEAEVLANETLQQSPEGAPVGLDAVIALERKLIEHRRKQLNPELEKNARATFLTGLSFSGGGIRSACFNLGLLEGLDRSRYQHPEQPAPKLLTGEKLEDCRHLELFDYISSVSGGSYAAGHLATAMLPGPRKPEGIAGSNGRDGTHAPATQLEERRQEAKPEDLVTLGDIALGSKTVPGWLWGVGVWFLGVAFQLLKTGSLLVTALALFAFVLRTLDAADVSRFCTVLGFQTDLSRGFIPFWAVLGIFLVAYGLNVAIRRPSVTLGWFVWCGAVIGIYVAWVWSHRSPYPDPYRGQEPLWFWGHYLALMALASPAVVACAVLLVGKVFRRRWNHIVGRVQAARGRERPDTPIHHAGDDKEPSFPLRAELLIPILVALFCLAGLVTTGDINLAPSNASSTHLAESQERSRELSQSLDRIYGAALWAIGAISLGFLFPKDLFKSARRIEDQDSGKGDAGRRKSKKRGWEPIFRVVIFLCSHGFVLLVVFVLYSTVAGENVSGYYEWRENFPSAAFHRDEFADDVKAWTKIERDASQPDPDPQGPPLDWGRLARLMVTAQAASWDESESLRNAEVRAWESTPWIVRLFPPLLNWGPNRPWKEDGLGLDPWTFSRPYDLYGRDLVFRTERAFRIASTVLDDPRLYETVPVMEEKNHDAWEDYLEKAEALRKVWDEGEEGANRRPEASVALSAAIRNNNRRALRFYLGDLMQDRAAKVIFASIVWREDQWTRLRIAGIAAVIWLLCCAVDVNSFSLQRFYRAHVIDSWVRTPEGRSSTRWLHETEPTYRSPGDCIASRPAAKPEPFARRAPLLLFNATLEGNRSAGDEPELSRHIFTFSRIASGFGAKAHWLNTSRERSLARRSRLDIGNIVATSGAFLSPGDVANPALSSLLHLLNIQTGYWARDPKKFGSRGLWESIRFHLCQSLGMDCEGDSRFMLTDGAHVENLGLYVLLQRRCSLIVASDCSQEDRSQKPERRFDALIQVLRQAGEDGIEIGPFLGSRAYRHWLRTNSIPGDVNDRDHCGRPRSTGLDLVRPPEADRPAKPSGKSRRSLLLATRIVRSLRGSYQVKLRKTRLSGKDREGLSPAGREEAAAGAKFAQEHYVFAQIIYPDKTRGLLVYLRPTITGDEGDGLLHGVADSLFPDDDPVDQFYTPAKMSTYRLLGRHIAEELMEDPAMKDALARIVEGEAATVDPAKGDARSDKYKNEKACEIYCTESDRSCDWNRQRRFRGAGTPHASTGNETASGSPGVGVTTG